MDEKDRYYMIVDLNLCVNATIKTMSFHVWRDVTRFAYQSTELTAGALNGYSIYRFATREALENAAKVLNGALFTEISTEEWEALKK